MTYKPSVDREKVFPSNEVLKGDSRWLAALLGLAQITM
jgi:hypothetical protein